MILFQNRYNYFKIQLYRNYNPIDLKDSDEFLNERISYNYLKNYLKNYAKCKFTKSSPRLSSFVLKNLKFYEKGKKTNFFYNNENDKSQFIFTPFPNATTDSESDLIKNYNNPFASVQTFLVERTVLLNDNKLIFKVITFTKYRDFNEKYYKKNRQNFTLTIDLNNGNIRLYSYRRERKKEYKMFRNNHFLALDMVIKNLLCVDHYNNTSKLKTGSEILTDNLKILSILRGYLPIPTEVNSLFDEKYLKNSILEYFVTKRNIKVPNQYQTLILENYPTEKILAKNDRKLIKSILVKQGIYSKITNKILHNYPNLSPKTLFTICRMFGDDYIKYVSQFNDNFFKLLVKYPFNHLLNNFKELNHNEKSNIVKIFKSLSTEDLSNVFITLFDQISMLKKMRSVLKYKHLTAKTIKELRQQHHKLSELYLKFNKGFENYIIYDEELISQIEEQIRVNYDGQLYIFNPVILKTSDDYIEEGSHMHHCVASYDDKHSSIIISLRLNGDDDRVTCEFDKETGMNRQSAYFCNLNPPTYFNEALEILNRKIYNLGKKNLLYHTDIVTKNIEIENFDIVNLPF